MSSGIKISIGVVAAIVLVGGSIFFLKNNNSAANLNDVSDTTGTTTVANVNSHEEVKDVQTTNETITSKPATKNQTSLSSTTLTKGSDILASGKATICTSPVMPNVNNSIQYKMADGNARIDTNTMGNESHVILKKDGTAYYWGTYYKGVLTGPQYTTSARLLLQFPLTGYTCVEQAIGASVFVPPAN